MREQGFAYATPFSAETDRKWQKTSDPRTGRRTVTPLEIETATADERCRIESNYFGKRLAAHADAQNIVISRNRDQVLRLQKLMNTRYANARRILGLRQE